MAELDGFILQHHIRARSSADQHFILIEAPNGKNRQRRRERIGELAVNLLPVLLDFL